jgi:predicted O-linked N-acetylglucosamine transferase (SPINDLY family)
MGSQFPQWSQPLSPRQLAVGEKVRVGIVSGFFYNHSNWKIPIKGWVQNLNRDRFELFGYYTRERQDAETEIAVQSFDRFLQGPLSVEAWAATIRQDDLDVLIFPEFGMDAMTVRLGGLRLAPVQATSWGHPETSGLPTIDYYLSSDLMEPENGQDCYTESLVRLSNLSIYYRPLTLMPDAVTRSALGLAEEDTFYWCCQSLYKYLPDHDDVFPRIAAQFSGSRFVFIAHISQQVTETFQRRLDHAFRQFNLNYQDYCRFLPAMKPSRFAGVSAIADVFLDSIGWSGCNSSLEVIAHNIPIVTWPGELMRGRHTLAMLKLMGLEDLVARDKEDYIARAVRLGQDPQYRRAISRHIAAHQHKLYEDLAPIRALEDFLWQVVH